MQPERANATKPAKWRQRMENVWSVKFVRKSAAIRRRHDQKKCRRHLIRRRVFRLNHNQKANGRQGSTRQGNWKRIIFDFLSWNTSARATQRECKQTHSGGCSSSLKRRLFDRKANPSKAQGVQFKNQNERQARLPFAPASCVAFALVVAAKTWWCIVVTSVRTTFWPFPKPICLFPSACRAYVGRRTRITSLMIHQPVVNVDCEWPTAACHVDTTSVCVCVLSHMNDEPNIALSVQWWHCSFHLSRNILSSLRSSSSFRTLDCFTVANCLPNQFVRLLFAGKTKQCGGSKWRKGRKIEMRTNN